MKRLIVCIFKAIEKHGRAWKAVAEVVGNERTNDDCQNKVSSGVKAGRMTEPE